MATILLVEDHPATWGLVVNFLEAAGQTVLEAGRALDALAVACFAVPDLILLDLRLPDGFEIARRLRREPRTAAVPILALTAYPSDHGVAALAESGCTGYLTKPVSRDLLSEARQHYLPEA